MGMRFLLLNLRVPIFVLALLTGCVSTEPGAALSRIEAYLGTGVQVILIEIDHAPARAPNGLATQALRDAVEEATGKRVEVLTPRASSRLLADEWSQADLDPVGRSLLDSAAPGRFEDGRSAVIHVLYVEGHYRARDGSDAVGVATSERAVLFDEGGPDLPTLPAETDTSALMERAILIHEVGHLLGLVDNGVPMARPHADPQSPQHSSNRESVMYYAVDGGRALLGQVGIDEPPYRFDADDLRDLKEERDRRAS